MPNTLHRKGKTETVPDYQVVIDYRTETTNGTNAPEFHIDRRLQEFGSKMSDLRSEFDKNPFETFESTRDSMRRLWLEESEAHSSDVKVYIDILKQEQAALAARTQKKVQAFGAAYMKQVQEMRRVVGLNAPLADERQEKSKHKGENKITKDEIEENKKLKKIWRYLTKLSHADPRLEFRKNSWRDDFEHFADGMLDTDLDKVLEYGSPLFDKDVILEISKYTADDPEDVIKRIKEIADGSSSSSSSPTDKEDDDEDDEDDDEEMATGGKKSRRKRTKRTRTTGGKKSRRRLRKRTTLKGGKRKRRRTRRRR